MEEKRINKVKQLLEEALSLEPSERENFLNEKCKDEPEIKAEVLSLLNSLNSSDDFLEAQVKEIDTKKNSVTDALIGKSIGPYLIDGIAGHGGMGLVYSGKRNDKEYYQKVAIKIIGFGLTSEYMLKRFQIERQTLANLQHPYITQLLDGGSTPDGLPYLVMEFVDGIPITKYADKNELAIDERLKLFMQVCSAVQYAHQNLVIHRDIKPGNILVTVQGIPKLLDFGIVKLIDDNLSGESEKLTRSDLHHFTPEYASPEQIKGEHITTASDIYSLGVLLYQLLTGIIPRKLKGLSLTELGKIITEENVLKPSDVVTKQIEDNTELDSDLKLEKSGTLKKRLKGDLDNIIMKAMHKEPSRRYVSVEQFSEDIRRHLVGLPVMARKDTTGYLLSKFIQRHKVGFISTWLFILLLIASVIIIAREIDITKAEMNKEKVDAKKAESVNNFLQNMLASADPYKSGKDVRVLDVLKKASKNVNTEFKGQPKIEAAIQSTIGNTFSYLGEYKDAETHLKRALTLNKQNYGEYSEETASSIHDLAEYYDWLGKLEIADSLFNESTYIFKKIETQPDIAMEINLSDFAALKNELDDYNDASQMYKECLKIVKKIKGNQSYETATVLNNLALTLDNSNKRKEAETYYKESEKIYISIYGKNSVEAATSYNNLAFIYAERNEFEKAKDYFVKTYKIDSVNLGIDHPRTCNALRNLGFIEFELKNYFAAINNFNKSVIRLKKSLPSNHLSLGASYYWLGRTYNEINKFNKAEKYLRKSLTIRLNVFPKGNDIVYLTEGELGISLLNQDKISEAKKFLLSGYKGYSTVGSMEKRILIRFVKNIISLYRKETDKQNEFKFKSVLLSLSSK